MPPPRYGAAAQSSPVLDPPAAPPALPVHDRSSRADAPQRERAEFACKFRRSSVTGTRSEGNGCNASPDLRAIGPPTHRRGLRYDLAPQGVGLSEPYGGHRYSCGQEGRIVGAAGAGRAADARPMPGWLRFLNIISPGLSGFLLFFGGGFMLLSAVTPQLTDRLKLVADVAPIELIEASHFTGSILATLMLFLAYGVARRLVSARRAAMALASSPRRCRCSAKASSGRRRSSCW